MKSLNKISWLPILYKMDFRLDQKVPKRYWNKASFLPELHEGPLIDHLKRWNNHSVIKNGQTSSVKTDHWDLPALQPEIVIRLGSPPKLEMYVCNRMGTTMIFKLSFGYQNMASVPWPIAWQVVGQVIQNYFPIHHLDPSKNQIHLVFTRILIWAVGQQIYVEFCFR